MKNDWGDFQRKIIQKPKFNQKHFEETLSLSEHIIQTIESICLAAKVQH